MNSSTEILKGEMCATLGELLRVRLQGKEGDPSTRLELEKRLESMILQGGHEVTQEFHEEVLEVLAEADPAARARLVERLWARGIHIVLRRNTIRCLFSLERDDKRGMWDALFYQEDYTRGIGGSGVTPEEAVKNATEAILSAPDSFLFCGIDKSQRQETVE